MGFESSSVCSNIGSGGRDDSCRDVGGDFCGGMLLGLGFGGSFGLVGIGFSSRFECFLSSFGDFVVDGFGVCYYGLVFELWMFVD